MSEGLVSWDQLVAEASSVLGESLGGDRRQEARWLVERVSGYSSAELLINGREPVSNRSVAFFDGLLARRQSGEPLQYVLGRWAFRTLDLMVDRRVLIPRPETEMVAGLAIDELVTRSKRNGSVVAADLGTGSGAIALSIATEVPSASVWACDLSEDALAVTRANLAGLGRAAARVTTAQGSWFSALPSSLAGSLDVVVSNPPYVAHEELPDLPDDVKDWEPHLALFADDEGRRAVHEIVTQASLWLKDDGVLVVEMQPNQTDWASELARQSGFVSAQIINDFAGKQRALVAQLARN